MTRIILVILGYAFISSAQQVGGPARLQSARDAFGDAFKSARLIEDSSNRDCAVSEIAQAEARSGLLSEAIATTAFASTLRDMALVDVASIAAHRGQYEVAVKAVHGESLFTQDRVREEIGIEQARRGDVRSALLTSDSMRDGYDRESVRYFACLELLRQGDRVEAERVARGFKSPDHELPKESEVSPAFDWRKETDPLPTPTNRIEGKCDALSLLQAEKVAEAASCVEARSNPADVAADLARLAERAADLGNLDAALTFANNSHLSGTKWEDGYIVQALGSIGRRWVTIDSCAASKWAKSRPTEFQRAIALAGVAEGIATSGHPLH